MTQTPPSSTGALWARFRFSVVGSLLSSPPAAERSKTAIHGLAAKTWSHPSDRTRRPVLGRHHRAVVLQGPTPARRPRRRPPPRRAAKTAARCPWPRRWPSGSMLQYREHPHWSYQLHYDNLAALVKADPSLGPLRSYSTVRRYMQAHGWMPKPRPRPKHAPAKHAPKHDAQTREVRSYEAEYVGSLWHLDFHHGSLKVLTPSGQWLRPIALGILDDHSRLCCHVQWYLSETAEDLVHGLSQAIQKRGLPRALLDR